MAGTCRDNHQGLVHLSGLSGFSNMQQHLMDHQAFFGRVTAEVERSGHLGGCCDGTAEPDPRDGSRLQGQSPDLWLCGS